MFHVKHYNWLRELYSLNIIELNPITYLTISHEVYNCDIIIRGSIYYELFR